MAYEKQQFQDGEILHASNLIKMEDTIISTEEGLGALEQTVGQQDVNTSQTAQDIRDEMSDAVDEINGDINDTNTRIDNLAGQDEGNTIRQIVADELSKEFVPDSDGTTFETVDELVEWLHEHPEQFEAASARISKLKDALDGFVSEKDDGSFDLGEKTVKGYIDDAVENVTFENATGSTHGLMSSADKAKLDSLTSEKLVPAHTAADADKYLNGALGWSYPVTGIYTVDANSDLQVPLQQEPDGFVTLPELSLEKKDGNFNLKADSATLSSVSAQDEPILIEKTLLATGWAPSTLDVVGEVFGGEETPIIYAYQYELGVVYTLPYDRKLTSVIISLNDELDEYANIDRMKQFGRITKVNYGISNEYKKNSNLSLTFYCNSRKPTLNLKINILIL